MICTRRRIWRSAAPRADKRLTPSKVTEPASGSVRRITIRDTVDLPQPDSPTRPKEPPLGMLNETSLTARTRFAGGPKSPPPMVKVLLRLATCSAPLPTGVMLCFPQVEPDSGQDDPNPAATRAPVVPFRIAADADGIAERRRSPAASLSSPVRRQVLVPDRRGSYPSAALPSSAPPCTGEPAH